MKQKFLHSFYALFLFTGVIQAQVVTLEGDNGLEGQLRQVIAEATTGDEITFAQNVKHIILMGEILIDKSLTITGNDMLETKIDADNKGRIFNITTNSASVILENMTLSYGSLSNDYGGAILSTDTRLTLSNVELSNNISTRGGAIYIASGKLNMTDCNLINNIARHGGGALSGYGRSTVINITGGKVSGNEATQSDGGGIYVFGEATITLDKVTVADNTARYFGGGLNVTGKLTITNSAIVNNTAYSGGGLLFNGDLAANISTSTFSGNIAMIDAAAIYNSQSLMFMLNASTVVNNTATEYGGGIFNDNGLVTLKNTIVAQNNATFGGADIYTDDVNKKFKSSGYNLIGQDNSDNFTAATGDLVGTTAAPIDPLVEDLDNNGGTTQTHKLLKGSPAYNTGNPLDEFKDQIGQAVFGGRRDIGACESQDVLGTHDVVLKDTQSKVWPNPSNGTIKINLSASLGTIAKGKLIEIRSGKTVDEFAVNGNSEINLQNYAAGLYIVRLESESVTENHKLIIR